MRRSFGDTGRRSDAPMAGTHSGTSLAESGWRRFGEPNQNVSPASDNSARRSGENGWRRQSAGTSAAPGESPSARPSQENQGWRRFGDNGARGSSVAPEQGTHMSGGGSRDQSGWRRFGEPSNGGAGAAPGADSGSFRRSGGAAPERVDRGGNWQRFSEAPASSGEPRGFSRGAEQSAPGSRMSSGDPGNSGRSSFRQDRGGEAVQIRPSIVQERAPSSFGGSRRGGGEAMSAPRSSGPPSSSGGGGGGGTRMSGGGGGGGGHSGGHSGGGGSGRGGRGR
jgi:hypothetical protein